MSAIPWMLRLLDQRPSDITSYLFQGDFVHLLPVYAAAGSPCGTDVLGEGCFAAALPVAIAHPQRPDLSQPKMHS
jgi:hypothetical protein